MLKVENLIKNTPSTPYIYIYIYMVFITEGLFEVAIEVAIAI